MKGKIELYYDMPHLEAYLKASGANYNESRLNGVLDGFTKQCCGLPRKSRLLDEGLSC